MLNLNNVTLVCVTNIQLPASIKAIKYSSRKIQFKKKLLITDLKQDFNSNNNNNNDIEILKLDIDINNIKKWCRFIVYDLHNYIDTQYILLVHDDGFVVNPECWDSRFLDYDYIGAPWPPSNKIFIDSNNQPALVGNSVSIRSKKILEMPSKLKIPWHDPSNFYHEDGFICCQHKNLLEANGINFAPFSLAINFSRENSFQQNLFTKTFAFHRWGGLNIIYPCFNKCYQLKKIIKRIFK